MYAYFKGIIAQKEEDGLILEVNRIGYHIFMPGSMLDALPGVGQEAIIHTYTYVKEDAMQLYGFLSRDDLVLFKMLISVSGIGPKGGLAVLSTLSADDLRFAILSEDAKAIAKAPGIGAKTAQKVVIELKDKISLEEALDLKKKPCRGACGRPERCYGGSGRSPCRPWLFIYRCFACRPQHRECRGKGCRSIVKGSIAYAGCLLTEGFLSVDIIYR